jgi:hypothetical protein
MANGSERLDRIERILERVAKSQGRVAWRHAQVPKSQGHVANSQQEMAARRQRRDEAFEQHDAQMKVIRETIAANAESIRRLEQLERGGRPNSSA